MTFKSVAIAEARACLQLAIPLAAVQLSEAAINFIDTIMMGQLGSLILAAGSLGTITFTTFLLVTSGMLSSVGAMAAISVGGKDFQLLRRVAGNGMLLSTIISIPLMVAIWNLRPILRHLGQSEEHLAIAEIYFHAIVWGFPAAVGFIYLKNLTSALNRPRLISIVMVAGILLNAIGNYVLMYGKFGFPELGLAGIGWASTFAFWAKLIVAAIGLSRDRLLRSYQLFKNGIACDLTVLFELIQLGIPAAMLLGVESFLFLTVSYLIGSLGTVSLAAHKIALQTAGMTFMVSVGIAYATTMRVGQYLGQKDWQGIRRAGFTGISLSALFMLATSVLFWCFPEAIIGMYLDTSNPENLPVVEVAKKLLAIAALFQLVDGIQAVAGGALRGIKDTRIPLAIGFFCYWAIGFSSGYYLGIVGSLQEAGLWWGLALGLASASVGLTYRFHCQSSGYS